MGETKASERFDILLRSWESTLVNILQKFKALIGKRECDTTVQTTALCRKTPLAVGRSSAGLWVQGDAGQCQQADG